MPSQIDMSWNEVEQAVANLLGQFKEHSYEPALIIAVAKGGVIPATLLHQAFPDAHFDTIYIRSYTEDGQKPPRVVGKTPVAPKWDKVLIVDDILETGGTRDFLKTIYPMATYAFMVCRQSMAAQCLFRGLIYEPGWINFPWEKRIVETQIPF